MKINSPSPARRRRRLNTSTCPPPRDHLDPPSRGERLRVVPALVEHPEPAVFLRGEDERGVGVRAEQGGLMRVGQNASIDS